MQLTKMISFYNLQADIFGLYSSGSSDGYLDCNCDVAFRFKLYVAWIYRAITV